VILAINRNLAPVPERDGEPLRKQRRSVKETHARIAIARSRKVAAVACKEVIRASVVHRSNYISHVNRRQLAAHHRPLPCYWIRQNPDRRTVVLVQPLVIEPGVAVMQVRDKLHAGKIERPSIFRAQNGGEILLVSDIELFLRQPWKERADDLINPRRHHHPLLQRNAGRRLRKEPAAEHTQHAHYGKEKTSPLDHDRVPPHDLRRLSRETVMRRAIRSKAAKRRHRKAPDVSPGKD